MKIAKHYKTNYKNNTLFPRYENKIPVFNSWKDKHRYSIPGNYFLHITGCTIIHHNYFNKINFLDEMKDPLWNV